MSNQISEYSQHQREFARYNAPYLSSVVKNRRITDGTQLGVQIEVKTPSFPDLLLVLLYHPDWRNKHESVDGLSCLVLHTFLEELVAARFVKLAFDDTDVVHAEDWTAVKYPKRGLGSLVKRWSGKVLSSLAQTYARDGIGKKILLHVADENQHFAREVLTSEEQAEERLRWTILYPHSLLSYYPDAEEPDYFPSSNNELPHWNKEKVLEILTTNRSELLQMISCGIIVSNEDGVPLDVNLSRATRSDSMPSAPSTKRWWHFFLNKDKTTSR